MDNIIKYGQYSNRVESKLSIKFVKKGKNVMFLPFYSNNWANFIKLLLNNFMAKLVKIFDLDIDKTKR